MQSRQPAVDMTAFMEVVKPASLKISNVVEGTHLWEAKVAAVENQYGERPSDCLMAAIFLGMLPDEYSRMAMRNQALGKNAKGVPRYEELRDYILSVGTQEGKAQKISVEEWDWSWDDLSLLKLTRIRVVITVSETKGRKRVTSRGRKRLTERLLTEGKLSEE